MSFLSHQQTTVEEQSRIMQLEEELSLRRAEIEKLQAKLGGSDTGSQQADDSDAAPGAGTQLETPVLPEQLVSVGHEHYKQSSELKEKYEAALAASQQEIDSLKALVENKSQEVSEMKQKVQQATKENMEMMDTWKVFCYILFNLNCSKKLHKSGWATLIELCESHSHESMYAHTLKP